jgi:hypothetical protein
MPVQPPIYPSSLVTNNSQFSDVFLGIGKTGNKFNNNLAGTSARFTVTATGSLPLQYQWRRNSAIIRETQFHFICGVRE